MRKISESILNEQSPSQSNSPSSFDKLTEYQGSFDADKARELRQSNKNITQSKNTSATTPEKSTTSPEIPEQAKDRLTLNWISKHQDVEIKSKKHGTLKLSDYIAKRGDDLSNLSAYIAQIDPTYSAKLQKLAEATPSAKSTSKSHQKPPAKTLGSAPESQQKPSEISPDIPDDIKINSPLHSEAFFPDIFQAYSESSGNASRFHNEVQRIGLSAAERADSGESPLPGLGEFARNMHARWHSSLSSLSDQEIISRSTKDPEYGQSLIKIRNFMDQHPECQNFTQTLEAATNAKKDSQEIQTALRDNAWFYLQGDAFMHVYSERIHPGEHRDKQTASRLYLNIDREHRMDFINTLTDTYEEDHQSYYFKFGQGQRTDNLVIYTSARDARAHLKAIRKTVAKNPELLDYLGEPPALTGKFTTEGGDSLDGKIGYGPHPTKKGESYSSNRANALYAAIQDTALDWAKDNSHRQLHSKEYGDLSLGEYLTKTASKSFLAKYVETPIWGLKPADLEPNSKYFKQVEQIFARNQSASLDAIPQNKEKRWDITTPNGHRITASYRDFRSAIASVVPLMSQTDPTFTDRVRQSLRQVSPKYGVDPDNFVLGAKPNPEG